MNTKNKLATAALAGLFSVGILAAGAAYAGEHESASCKGASGCKGNAAVEKAECKGASGCKTEDGKEKHACKGLNSCKGQGADGKNECKGHGSCATDGSQPVEAE
jgi:hypothetical protein